MKIARRAGILVGVMWIVGCAAGCDDGSSASSGGGSGQGGGTSAGGKGGGTGATGTGAGGGVTGGSGGAVGGSGGAVGGTGGGTGGSAPVIPACYTTCTTVNDCANPASVIVDADNWKCAAGVCEYTGCNSTQECKDGYNSPNYVCKAVAGSSYKACYPTCTTANDCANPASVIVDADNWKCAAGVCEYTGCNSTQECKDGYNNPNYVCKAVAGSSYKACYTTCSTVNDCANPASVIVDADNWECAAGACEYTGCNSTQECKDGYNSPNYVCK